MVYLRIKDNTPAAKKMLEYLKIMPYVEIIEKDEMDEDIALGNAIEEGLKSKKVSKQTVLKSLKK